MMLLTPPEEAARFKRLCRETWPERWRAATKMGHRKAIRRLPWYQRLGRWIKRLFA